MICLSLYDNKDVQCYRSLLYFLIEEKLFINWCLISKVFRHEKCSYSVPYGREKPNLHSNLHAHVEYKSQHIQHNSTILIKKILFVIKEKIKVICNKYNTYTFDYLSVYMELIVSEG